MVVSLVILCCGFFQTFKNIWGQTADSWGKVSLSSLLSHSGLGLSFRVIPSVILIKMPMARLEEAHNNANGVIKKRGTF